ncbi:hypothetical protein NEDG_01137 [Nematocida displodere]|uniref:AAA+ ATPase domain-containing protein n=1 Tax=Nematocida displodere TaxID=1805483 RepID=A0A177EB14_9MICR|nr:hypothetical protein NEDG_01137 [Nematocida displodere]
MQENFFKLQELLEELTETYTSPYNKEPSTPETLKRLRQDYEYFLTERRSCPDNTVLVHDYASQAPLLTISEVEALIRGQKAIREVLPAPQTPAPAIPQTKPLSSTLCSNCQNKIPPKTDFATAKALLPNEVILPAPKTQPPLKKQKTEDKALEEIDPECNVESRFLQMIYNEVMVPDETVKWTDIAGLSKIKAAIEEIIVWPIRRPDLFQGLRGPPKALLLFGPPGTGKTLIGKCIASQSKSTFFSISASSLTSKWMGEGEKMVRALFFVATKSAPSVVFIDEIDSLLMQRSDGENEGTRRIKTEFLIQMDGAKKCKDNVLVIGATNRPHEIDEAARRRFVKRLYVPLPDSEGRIEMVQKIGKNEYNLPEEEIKHLAQALDGYSGSDIFNLCREAAMEPVREIKELDTLTSLRSINIKDFLKATKQIRQSVSLKDLEMYEKWNKDFGSL